MPERQAERAVVDTSVFVALLQDEVDRAENVQRLLEGAEAGEIRVLVSTVTITEVIKGPRADDQALSPAQERVFTDFMDNPYITLVSVDPLVAQTARDLRRAVPKLKTPDAIQIATALVTNADVLYTYDKDDLLRLDGDPALAGLRVLEPPIERQLTLVGDGSLGLEEAEAAAIEPQ